MRESLETDSEEDVLMTKAKTKAQIQELTTPFQPDTLTPNTKVDVVFLEQGDVTTRCQNYGRVFAPGQPDPSRCHVTGIGTEVVVGEYSSTILQAENFEG